MKLGATAVTAVAPRSSGTLSILASLKRYKFQREMINNQRFYRIDGFRDLFPSVTTVLNAISKPAVASWEKRSLMSSVKASLLAELGKDNGKWLKSVDTRAKEQWYARRLSAWLFFLHRLCSLHCTCF